RVIDRPMRPLFPKDYRNDVTLNNLVMSVDPECRPEIVAMIGTALAVHISDIPFDGPCAMTQMGLVDGEFIVNPSQKQWDEGDLQLTVASTKEKVIMIEAGANEIPEDQMIEAIYKCHDINQTVIAFMDQIRDEIGKPKHEYESCAIPEQMFEDIKKIVTPEQMEEAVFTDEKQKREENIRAITEQLEEAFADNEEYLAVLGEAIYQYQKKTVRKMILKDHKRPDGRAINQIRPLAAEVDLIPRVHGSAMFTRGQTQICDVVTLAPLSEIQKIDGLDANITTKRYMHHYNFPAYSVGETKVSRGPGRREIGHGALAEKALVPVLPSIEEFPYTIRAVSETFESNGSTSMASTCASCMSLMAAGVPIKAMVAGISCGLVTGDTDDDFLVLTDIQGLEDFFGDMDFKVTGTHKGITAIQMDIKIHGLTRPIVEEAIARTREARLYIMDEVMSKAIAEPRKEVNEWAPKIEQITIDPSKIGDVVGQKGKTINEIIDRTGVKIDITDDGAVSVCGTDKEMIAKAIDMIKIITTDFEQGQILEGTVVSIKEFGAFIEFAPGKEGMVHISKIAKERINRVEDVLTLGDKVKVVCLGKDKMGRISFSMKDVKED
ncbi:MAG TPA: polyribonucleotide nucleotidyltransferase, partial [Eubacterium sp.]|nr:polyribonucleotide nucleotidyltransferase [Eubacterium sp.]